MTSEGSLIRTALSGRLRLELIYREYSAPGVRAQVGAEKPTNAASEKSDDLTKLPAQVEL